MLLSNLQHEKLLVQLRIDLKEQKNANLKLVNKCRSMEDKFLHDKQKHKSEEKEKQIAFKKDLDKADRDLSDSLQKYEQLQERFDELRSEKEKITYRSI